MCSESPGNPSSARPGELLVDDGFRCRVDLLVSALSDASADPEEGRREEIRCA